MNKVSIFAILEKKNQLWHCNNYFSGYRAVNNLFKWGLVAAILYYAGDKMRKCKGSVLAWITWCVLTLCMALSVASSAKADMGPKPNVTIKFKNLPDTRFVIALLTKGDEEYVREDKREYLKGKTDPYDPDDLMYQKIYRYEADGWKIAFGPGGDPFMANYGEDGLTSSFLNGSARFSYYAPSDFKVLLVTADGTQYVSNEIKTTKYSAICIYDLATGELVEDLENYQEHDKQDYVGMAKLYLTGTLMVEGFLLILFGLSQARNLPIFFLANILTQIYMHVDGWYYEMHHGSGGMAGTIHYIVKEILIILVECLLYAFFMKQKNGKKLRIILYAVIANLVSMVTSLYVGGPLGTRVLFWGFMIVAYIVALIIYLHNEKKKENDEQI